MIGVPSRRQFILTATATPLWLAAGGVAFAGLPGDRRFVFVILRGAMDGLHAVPPIGDPNYASARGGMALSPESVVALDRHFALHPSLAEFSELYRSGELLVVHATASPYRDRSHFDGQDVLEAGGTVPHELDSGWLNRSLQALGATRTDGLAVSQGVPLSLRGRVPVVSWAPSPLPSLAPGRVESLRALYRGDPIFEAALEEGVQGDSFAAATLGDDPMAHKPQANFAQLAEEAGRLLAAPNGPRVGVIEIGGWDTHLNQGLATGRMADVLKQFNQGLLAMRAAMGAAWKSTIVLAASEFGRTVAMNGTNGTDHGTATAVFVLGGAVQGGRVPGRWPGLSRDALYQGRDLAPTTDLRSVIKGILGDHLGVTQSALSAQIFPGSADVAALNGLVRT